MGLKTYMNRNAAVLMRDEMDILYWLDCEIGEWCFSIRNDSLYGKWTGLKDISWI